MNAPSSTLREFKTNRDWAKLPLFDRKGWKRLPFAAFAESVNKRVEPSEAADEIYVGLEHLGPQDLHIREWGKGSDVIGTKLPFPTGNDPEKRRKSLHLQHVQSYLDIEGGPPRSCGTCRLNMDAFLRMAVGDRRLVCLKVAEEKRLQAASVDKDFWICWALREVFTLGFRRT